MSSNDYKRLCRFRVNARIRSCLVVVSLVFSSSLQAQRYDIPDLVFDPVPLALEYRREENATEDVPVVTELAELPSRDPVALKDWLAANRTGPAAEGEELQSDIESYRSSVNEVILAEGPFAAQLPQQLLSLGTALQKEGQLDEALEHFDRATHVTRINQGLFSAEQIPIIRKTIENHLLRGDLVAADNQQEYLLYLQQKNFGLDSAALLPALNAYADWNIFAFSAETETPLLFWDEQSSLAVPAISERYTSDDELKFRVERLINAQHVYWSIIQILRDNFGYEDNRLLEYEMRLALTNYFYATSVPPHTDAYTMTDLQATPGIMTSRSPPPALSSMGYRHGRDALERRLDYMQQMDDVDSEALMAANIDLADWMLYFRRQRNQAMDHYQQIYDEFSTRVDRGTLNAQFSPAYPKRLPTFIRNTLSREGYGIPEDVALIYRGYVDVQFDMNRYGNAQSVRILASTPETSEEVEDRLLRSLRDAHFRPRFENGEPRTGDTIRARYYYAY